MKKFIEGVSFVLGFFAVIIGAFAVKFAENTRDYGFILIAIGLMLLIVGASFAADRQAKKTRCLLRKLHGKKLEEGEDE